eukprot:6963556-Heterocapsa_arctica.AAC.1
MARSTARSACCTGNGKAAHQRLAARHSAVPGAGPLRGGHRGLQVPGLRPRDGGDVKVLMAINFLGRLDKKAEFG